MIEIGDGHRISRDIKLWYRVNKEVTEEQLDADIVEAPTFSKRKFDEF